MSPDESLTVFLLGMVGVLIFIAIVLYVITAVAYWKIFSKAGEPGWKGLIPIYSTYIQYKITWTTGIFWVLAACAIVGTLLSSADGAISILGDLVLFGTSVLGWVSSYKLSKAFGHGIGFTLGLIFLNPIFMLILAFNGDTYQGPQ